MVSTSVNSELITDSLECWLSPIMMNCVDGHAFIIMLLIAVPSLPPIVKKYYKLIQKSTEKRKSCIDEIANVQRCGK